MSNGEAERQSASREKRRAIVILALMAVAMVIALWQLRNIKFDNRVETWLPADDPQRMELNWFHEQFGEETTLLISWDGSSLNDPRVEDFAAELAGRPNDEGVRTQYKPGISQVRTPRDLIRRMLDNNVDRDTAVRELEGVLIGEGSLKVRLTAAGKANQDEVTAKIQRQAQEKLGINVEFLPPDVEQQSGEQAEADEDNTFVEGEFSGPGVDDPYPLPPRHDFQIRWDGIKTRSPESDRLIELCRDLVDGQRRPLVEDCFYAPGAPAALMVSMSDTSDEEIEKALTTVRQAAEIAGIPEPDLHMGGSPYGRSELNHAAQGSSWNPAYPIWMFHKRSPVLTSALVGILLAFFMLRSVKLAILILLSNVFVVVVTTALLPATGQPMNMVLIVLPNFVMVLSASAAIHLSNYWVHEYAKRPAGSVDRAVRTAFTPSLFSIATNIVGLLSLLTSVLTPVRDFGLYSSVGCLIMLVTIMVGLPAMLRFWRGPVPSLPDVQHSYWMYLGEFVYNRWRTVLVASVLLFGFGVWGLQWFRTETKVVRYFRPEARIFRDYEFLEQNLAGIAPVEIVVAFDKSVLGRSDDESADADVLEDETVEDETGAEAAPAGLVINSVRRMELIRKIKEAVAVYPETSGTLALSDFRPPLEPPPDDAAPLVKVRFNRIAYEMDRFLKAAGEEGGDQGLVTIARTPLKSQTDEDSFVIGEGAELWRIRAQVALLTDLDYSVLTRQLSDIVSQHLEGIPGTAHVVTGMVPVFLRTQEAMVESLVNSFGVAFAVMACVMVILLKNPVAGMLTMWPSLMPVIFVFGMISLAGVPVDIGTMITASVALGIADDERFHELAWFKSGLQRGLSRKDAICQGLAHCGSAMVQTSAVIGLSLLMLAGSDLLLVRRFGWLMSALIGAAVISDLLITPALLAGPLGTLIEPKKKSTPAASDIEQLSRDPQTVTH